MNKILALCLLAMACAGSTNEGLEDTDLGQTEEAWTVQCDSSFFRFYGVDVGNPSWANLQCNKQSSSAVCAFPWEIGHLGPGTCNGANCVPNSIRAPFQAFPIALGSGFTAGDRQTLVSAGAAAGSYIDSQFYTCTNRTGGTLPGFRVSSSSSSGDYLVLNKGTISGSASATNPHEDTNKFLHLACSRSLPMSENYPMSSATKCTNWTGTLDYDKLFFWANGNNCGSACVNKAVRNVLQKAFVEALGVGLITPTSSSLDMTNSLSVSKLVVQSGWPNGENNWVCNAANAPEYSGILTCN